MKDTNHHSIWDSDSGFSYQHQTSTAHSGPSGPSNYHALKQSSNNQQSQQSKHQSNSQKKYKDSFEEEMHKQFDQQLQQQASSHHDEAATAPHASYSLFTHHTEYQPTRQQQQNQHQDQQNNNFEGQESQHMPPVFYHPPSNTATHEDQNDIFKGMDFDALLEASQRDFAQTFSENSQFQPDPQPQFAGGRQFTFHVPQQNQQYHHQVQHHQNQPQQYQYHHQQHNEQQLLGEEMMTQASQPHAVMVAPPPAFVSPIPLMHPPHPIQLIKITQPMIPHK